MPETFPASGYFCSDDKVIWLWHLLVNLYIYIWLIISSCYCSIPFTLELTRRDGGLSTLCHSCEVGLSAEGNQNVLWPWLSLLQGWDILAMTFTGKFVYVTHYFIFLLLNLFDITVDMVGWWFKYSILQLRVYLSAGDAKKVSWLWPFPLQWWVSLTMAFTDKLLYMAHNSILIRSQSVWP